MPAKQRRRLHDHQGAAPLEQLRNTTKLTRVAASTRGAAHLGSRNNASCRRNEQILGAHSLRRAEEQHATEGVLDQPKCDPPKVTMRSSCHTI